MEEKEITRNGLTFIVDVDAYDKIIKRTDENVDKMQQELDKLKIENNKLKQWDKNKDTRNSRQRIANAKLIKENKELQEKLNKYNNQSNYKSAWNRLKKRNLLLRTPDMRLLTHEMEEQEKIFNLGGKE